MRQLVIVAPAVGLVVAVLLIFSPRRGTTTFRISVPTDAVRIPDLIAPAMQAAWALWTVAAALAVVAILLRVCGHHHARLGRVAVALFAATLLLSFLSWAAAGATLPVVGLLAGSLSLAVPLAFGSLAGVLGERAGVVNIAIEAQLLLGAFSAAVVSSLTQQPLAGLVAAGVGGLLVALVLAAFSTRYAVDQVIVGVVLNVLVIGLTSFFVSTILTGNPALNSPPAFDTVPIPLLSAVPVLGPVLFRQTIIVYLLYVTVAVSGFVLYRTRWGLRIRAVGEHPQAADTVGIRVQSTRFTTVVIAGGVAGVGGAFFTIGSGIAFSDQMTAGAGYIALAAVIFGRWDPARAALAGLLFGLASNLQNTLSVIGSPVPSEFMLMLPYVVTLFAVAGLIGAVRGPAAIGKPYESH